MFISNFLTFLCFSKWQEFNKKVVDFFSDALKEGSLWQNIFFWIMLALFFIVAWFFFDGVVTKKSVKTITGDEDVAKNENIVKHRLVVSNLWFIYSVLFLIGSFAGWHLNVWAYKPAFVWAGLCFVVLGILYRLRIQKIIVRTKEGKEEYDMQKAFEAKANQGGNQINS